VLDLENAPTLAPLDCTHPVRRITDPEQIGEAVSVPEKCLNKDRSWLVRRLADEIRHDPESLSVYAIYLDGQPVSSARMEFAPGSPFASLWGGATLPAYRHRGLYSALLAARIEEARSRGRRYLTVDAGAMSHPILEKRGFVRLTGARPCLWRVAGQARA
jgi:GNAT superfamily N-acetyltransferase